MTRTAAVSQKLLRVLRGGMYVAAAALAAIFVTLFFEEPPAPTDPLDMCMNDDPRRALAGCSAAIEQEEMADAELILALSRRSDIHLAAGAFSEAVGDRARALMLDPRNETLTIRLAAAHVERGRQSTSAGRIDAAIADFEDAALFHPESGALNDILALLYTQRGKTRLKSRDAAAIDDFNAALAREPRNAEALLFRALAHEQTGYLSNAAADYKAAVDIEPGNSEASQGLTRAAPAAVALIKLLQIELKRLGCDVGPVDGRWGQKSQAALAGLSESSDTRLAAHARDQPNQMLLNALRGTNTPICQKRGATTAPAAPAARRTDGNKSCFTFNMQTFCE